MVKGMPYIDSPANGSLKSIHTEPLEMKHEESSPETNGVSPSFPEGGTRGWLAVTGGYVYCLRRLIIRCHFFKEHS